ncbi:MAG: zinc ABC transporter substrate-binding protein [Acidobacteriota bacterium]
MAIVGVLLLGWALLAPVAAATSSPGSPLRVTVTIPPLVWLVSSVAGPDVEVAALVDAGESPETFQPTDRQVTDAARSEIFFRVGVTSEQGNWLQFLERRERPRVVDLREGVALRAMAAGHGRHHAADDPGRAQHFGSEDHGLDPHIWLSPQRLEIMAGTIAAALAEVLPGRKAVYDRNAAAVRSELRRLDEELRTALAPVRGRTFFVVHPAWGYFAHDYGLRQVAFEAEGQAPSEAELSELVRKGRRLGIRTLFVQPQTRSSAPASLARALGARLETLDPLAVDLPENLRRAGESLRVALAPNENGP